MKWLWLLALLLIPATVFAQSTTYYFYYLVNSNTAALYVKSGFINLGDCRNAINYNNAAFAKQWPVPMTTVNPGQPVTPPLYAIPGCYSYDSSEEPQ